MSNLNKAMLIGRLGADPEIKSLPSGDSVCNFSVATSKKWNKDGETHEKTEWHRIVAFGKLADVCGQYLTKGKLVYVEGELQTRSWEDKEGNKRYTTEIKAFTVQFLSYDDKPKDQASAPAQESEPKTKPQSTPASAPVEDDDLPF